MAAVITLKHEIRCVIGNEEKVMQHGTVIPTIALADDNFMDRPTTITAAATVTLWDAAAVGSPTSFTFFYFLTNVACDVEFTANNGHASETIFTLRAAPGVPIVLGADDSYYGNTGLAGTLDVIDLVRAKNASSTDDATVRYAVAS